MTQQLNNTIPRYNFCHVIYQNQALESLKDELKLNYSNITNFSYLNFPFIESCLTYYIPKDIEKEYQEIMKKKLLKYQYTIDFKKILEDDSKDSSLNTVSIKCKPAENSFGEMEIIYGELPPLKDLAQSTMHFIKEVEASSASIEDKTYYILSVMKFYLALRQTKNISLDSQVSFEENTCINELGESNVIINSDLNFCYIAYHYNEELYYGRKNFIELITESATQIENLNKAKFYELLCNIKTQDQLPQLINDSKNCQIM